MTRFLPYSCALLLLLCACQREELQPGQPDTIPPLPPAGLGIDAAHDGLIEISWLRNTEPDVDSYVILRREPVSADFQPIDSTGNRYYIDVQRGYDTTYEYMVVAVDEAGNRSAPSSIVSAKASNRDAPDAPEILYAAGHALDGRRSFRVEWPPVEASDLAGYIVYAAGSQDVKAEAQYFLANTNATMIDDTTAVAYNQARFYAVVAVDRGGMTSAMSQVAGDYITRPPELLHPADMASVRDYPFFTWKQAAGATGYRVSVMGSVAGDELWAVTLDDTGDAEYGVIYLGPSLAVGKIYSWRVATLTRPGGDVNAVSATRSFQMVP